MEYTNKYITVFLLLALMIYSCSQDNDDEVYNSNLIFENSYEITIPNYSYTDSLTNTRYNVTGDTITDTLNGTPVFQWKNTHSAIASCAIFSQPIVVNNNQIDNINDIVWQWHSGMDADEVLIKGEKYFWVSYNWGYSVLKKKNPV